MGDTKQSYDRAEFCAEANAMTHQYDDIADRYRKSMTLPVREMIEDAFQHYVGDVAGKSVLDLACGNGQFTRRYKQRGAARVVGVDVSSAMIAQAQQDEADDPLGIEYVLSDVQHVGKLDDFDLVVASFLLNYAATQAELLKMCQTAFANLKSDQRFVTLTQNVRQESTYYGTNYQPYGMIRHLPGGSLEDGAIVHWQIQAGDNWVEFDTYHLSQSTHESALQMAGFTNIRWHDTSQVSEPLQQAYGSAFWEYVQQHPPFVVIECRKPPIPYPL